MRRTRDLFCTIVGLFLICARASADIGVAASPVTAFWPTNGVVGADIILVGANLDKVSAVWFNKVGAVFQLNTNTDTVLTPTFQIQTGSQFIVATVPPLARSGPIYVTTPAGTMPVPGTFTAYPPPPPVIYNLWPSNGVPGTTVTITGDRFDTASAVRFNGVDSVYRVIDNAAITAVVPAQATTGNIFIVTTGGTNAAGSWFTVDTARPQPPSKPKVAPH